METTINIKLDEKQVEDIVKKVTENIIKKAKEDSVTTLTINEPKKLVKMYLEANESGWDSELKRVYWGFVYNSLNNEHGIIFNLDNKQERIEVEKLKSQGWKEEVFYK